MLVLTQTQVRQTLSMAEAIDLVQTALVECVQGRADIPTRLAIRVPQADGICLFMPGYIPALHSLGHKVIVEFPRNQDLGLPPVTGLFTLLDERTGLVDAVMDARYLTILRTGAVTGVALRCLADPRSRVAALLGPGAQAPGQVAALATVLPDLDEVRVWGRRAERAHALAEQTRADGLPLPLRVVESAESAVRGADVVIASTSARSPVVADAWVNGSLVCAVGSHTPDAQEIESSVVARAAKVVADTRAGVLAATGELLIPISQGMLDPERVWDLGEVVAGTRPGREGAELIFFKSSGFAALDLAVGRQIVERACQLGLGLDVDLLS